MQTMDENVKGNNQGMMNYVMQWQKAYGTFQIGIFAYKHTSHPYMLITYDLPTYV